MMLPPPPADDVERARQTETAYRLVDGIYILGGLQKGVTVYRQQVRAHNLVWALWELARRNERYFGRVAIVGGGIAGLTAAACVMSRFDSTAITLFERRWDLCPLQQGSDHRWVHPRIYDWPLFGSRAPEATLPVLNWSEGRASDVARQILEGFSAYCRTRLKGYTPAGMKDEKTKEKSKSAKETDATKNELRVYLGVGYLSINAFQREIDWTGHSTIWQEGFFRIHKPEGATEKFDTIIVATGFGKERDPLTPSYWRNDQLGQPMIVGAPRTWVVSGYGDGAITDLCRLSIERFRQDTILYELFGNKLDSQENMLRDKLEMSNEDIYSILTKLDLASIQLKLANRLRKDVRVLLQATGPRRSILHRVQKIFTYSGSSFQHKFLLYLLYKCGGFTISFDPLSNIIEEHQISDDQVVRRHGTLQAANVLDLFSDRVSLVAMVDSMSKDEGQRTERLWRPGAFRPAR